MVEKVVKCMYKPLFINFMLKYQILKFFLQMLWWMQFILLKKEDQMEKDDLEDLWRDY